MEYIPRNPLIALGNFRDANAVDRSADKLQYYTPEQFQRYIKAAENTAKSVTEWGYYVFFSIAFYTGARKGEINALKWSDIDGNIIHIRRSIAQKLKGGDVETPPKNKSSYRDLQISELTRRLEHSNVQMTWIFGDIKHQTALQCGLMCLWDIVTKKIFITLQRKGKIPMKCFIGIDRPCAGL